MTALINAAMKSPDWNSTAIFLAWDNWGGFYDHVVPPNVNQNGYGLRVPALVISPYAKKGYIDNQTLSSDAYLKFIEDDFLNGARLSPKTDEQAPCPAPTSGKPSRYSATSTTTSTSAPRRASRSCCPPNPPTDSPSIPPYFKSKPACLGCTVPPPVTGSARLHHGHHHGHHRQTG